MKRSHFLSKSTQAAAELTLLPSGLVLAQSANEKLNKALIGFQPPPPATTPPKSKFLLVMKTARLHRAIAALALLLFANLSHADMNVLIVGSTQSFSDSESGASDVAHEKAFNPTDIATQLQSILSQDGAITGTVNVEFEDIYKAKPLVVPIGGGGADWPYTFRCYSLGQHFMWPENKATRMANLRGEGDHPWDYIVLCGDPYIMANFPGMYAEGVKLIQSEIANSANPAQLILLGQWPKDEAGVSSSASFGDIVHRVGDSGGIPVAAGAKAWASYTSKDTDTAHPTPKGQYLAAAAIYSKMFNRSASSSGFTYNPPGSDNDGDAIADHVWSEVQAVAPGTEYTGKYTTQNAFQMEYQRSRTIKWNEHGTSTEGGFAGGLREAFDKAYLNQTQTGGSASNPVDMSYSRGTDVFEDDKQYNYLTRLDEANRVHGFPIGDHRGQANTEEGQLTMRYGIDKRYYNGSNFLNGTDLGVAYSMVREGEIAQNVHGIPVRLLWSKMEHANLGLTSHRDGWHLSRELDQAVGAYLMTVLTGRCPIEAEPADNTSTAWKQWWCRKLGYETAWRMAHLSSRVPGFRVTPSSKTLLSVTPGTTETMTVQFIYPPESDVSVAVSSSDATAAIVGPQTLVFTPSNYNVPQTITVAGVEGPTTSAPFTVDFTTTSNDAVYDGLSDSWAYTTTRAETVVTPIDQGTSHYTTAKNLALRTHLDVPGAFSVNTTFAGPNHGSLAWDGDDIVYTPDTDYVGRDGFAYWSLNSFDATTLSTGYIDIEVLNAFSAGSVRAVATDSIAAEEGPSTGTVTITREGDTSSPLSVNFSIGGSAALTEDYTLSASSPVTIPAGQSSVDIILTPVDDSVLGELKETAVLTVVAGSGYDNIGNPATVTIQDNDNTPPVVDAGSYGSVIMEVGVPATQVLNLAGSVTDAEVAPVSNWVLVSSDPADQTVTFGDPALVDSSVTFTEPGSYVLRLTADDGYGPVDDEVTIMVILLPQISVSAPDATATEAGSGTGTFTISRTGDTSDPLNVNFVFGGTATEATDYSSDVSSPVEIPAGQSSISVTITPLDDADKENSETISVTITPDPSYTVGTTEEVTIIDDDNTPPIVDAGADKTSLLILNPELWTPAQIATVAWFDASDNSTITESGGLVSQWNDKSGNGNHATQPSSGSQPAYDSTSNRITGGSAKKMSLPTDMYLGKTSGSLSFVGEQVGSGAGWGKVGSSGLKTHSPWTDGRLYDCFLTGGRLSSDTTSGLPGTQTLQSRVHTGANMEMYSDGVEVQNAGSTFDASTSSAELFGQHADYTLYEVVFLPDADASNRQKVEGYLAHKWGTALPAGHPYENAAPVSSAVSVSLADASVTDADSTDTLTASWSVVSKVPSDAADPIFGDTSLVNTTATFIEAGTYTLRLTVDDGVASVSDDVVITLSAIPAEYAAWSSGGGFANAFTDTAPNANPDGDSSSNLMEFAFGTDPTLNDANVVTSDGSTHGKPMMKEGTTAGSYEFFFMRRKDHGATGSVSYTPQFSTDLGTFTDNNDVTNPPVWVADSTTNTNYEVVKVPYPLSKRFARLKVESIP